MKYRNSEGYMDVTACAAIGQVVEEEQKIEKNCIDTLCLIKRIANLAGFKVIGRITLEHRSTGRVFK